MTTKIRGVALAPGISKNSRFYSREAIAAAVEQAQPRVKAGQLLMRAHHDAADTLGYVGRVTSLRVAEDGSAQFEGELADTSTAKDVRSLVRGERPFINAVSIAGEWTGKVQRQNGIESAPGLILHSIDFTANPGVDAARIRVAESVTGRRLIFEEAPGPVMPVAPEYTERDYATMTNEEFHQAAGDTWAAVFAAADERRQANPSPFWRGLTRDQAI